jgi:hypothetical protein
MPLVVQKLPKPKPKPKHRWRRALGVAAVVLIFALVATTVAVYKAAQHVPEFYSEALAADSTRQPNAGDKLEHDVLKLTNEVKFEPKWEATFTAEQINGWLAVDLLEKFPHLLPPEVSNPRVAIAQDEIKVACRYKSGQIDAVISLVGSVSLTNEPNVVAVRIKRARAGALPIPLSQFLEDVSRAAADHNLDLRWAKADGDDVALIRLPVENTHLDDRTLHLDSFELKPGAAHLSGRTQWKKR